MFFNKPKMLVDGKFVISDGDKVYSPIGYGVAGDTVDLYFEDGPSLSLPVDDVMIELKGHNWRPLR